MAHTLTFYLVLTPQQDELLGDAHAIAKGLLGLDPDGWEAAQEESEAGGGTRWVSAQGDARIIMHEPAKRADGGTDPAWMEITGFPGGGRVRWTLASPARLLIEDLHEKHADAVWGHQRAQQQARLRDWITGRIPQRGKMPTGSGKGGFRSLLGGLLDADGASPPVELSRVSKPPYAPEETAAWLYKGKLSNLGRYIEEADQVIASIAHPEFTSRRLLFRPYQRQGWQTLVPLFFLPAGHRFAGDTTSRTFSGVEDVANALYDTLSRYERYDVAKPSDVVRRKTDAEVLYLSRFGALEQSHPDPYNETRAIARTPGKRVRLRLLEARGASWIPGRSSGLLEYQAEGLDEGAQVFVTGTMREGGGYTCRYFCSGPRERVDDLATLIGQALK